MASAGPSPPSTCVDDASIGTAAWTNPGNATAQDATYAIVSAIATQSHYLKATGFGFSIPAGATISGIQLDVLRHGGGTTKDLAVRLVKAGTIGATDRSSATVWPGTDTFANYGSGSDLWGDTWTPADINSATFGAALAAQDPSSLAGNVDFMRITVTYSVGGIVQTKIGVGSSVGF